MRHHIAACNAGLFILFCLPVQTADGPVSLITDSDVFIMVLRQSVNYPLEKSYMIIYDRDINLEMLLKLVVLHLLND